MVSKECARRGLGGGLFVARKENREAPSESGRSGARRPPESIVIVVRKGKHWIKGKRAAEGKSEGGGGIV